MKFKLKKPKPKVYTTKIGKVTKEDICRKFNITMGKLCGLGTKHGSIVNAANYLVDNGVQLNNRYIEIDGEMFLRKDLALEWGVDCTYVRYAEKNHPENIKGKCLEAAERAKKCLTIRDLKLKERFDKFKLNVNDSFAQCSGRSN